MLIRINAMFDIPIYSCLMLISRLNMKIIENNVYMFRGFFKNFHDFSEIIMVASPQVQNRRVSDFFHLRSFVLAHRLRLERSASESVRGRQRTPEPDLHLTIAVVGPAQKLRSRWLALAEMQKPWRKQRARAPIENPRACAFSRRGKNYRFLFVDHFESNPQRVWLCNTIRSPVRDPVE